MMQMNSNQPGTTKYKCPEKRQFCGNQHKNSRIDINFEAACVNPSKMHP
jgi:hypothetical protein